MTSIYCGNNARDARLLSGALSIGTRAKCLRKGIGVGRNLPVDPSYAAPYAPIDARRIYCGDRDDLPDGYDLFGSLPWCLQKGVGVGKAQRATQGFSPGHRSTTTLSRTIPRSVVYVAMLGIGAFALFLTLYLVMLGLRQKKNKKRINWRKFSLVYSIMLTCYTGILFLLYYYGQRL